MHDLMIASGMPRFCHTPACKIKESLIELKRVTNSKTGELEESYILSDFTSAGNSPMGSCGC